MIREYIIKVDDTKTDIMGGTPLEEQPKELVRCKDCRHRDPEDRKCDCGGMPFDTQIFPVPDDWFCPYGERKDGDGN